ncbi:MAG: hypothetical protein LBF79_03305 [Dysgonamonadaceae bacterium]|jgi:hypothetical protein|nr:hypothetical protein [Dysgonamonadaceae bacterium]
MNILLSKIKPCFGYLASGLSALMLFASCNEGEGLGGRASIEGYVYEVVHFDDNYSFWADTTKNGKAGVKVYITAEDDDQVLDNIDTGPNGYYRFDYLRKGQYRVYAESKDKWDNQTLEIKNVKIGSSGTSIAEPIYYHRGDIYNTAMIKGRVWVKYYTKFEDNQGNTAGYIPVRINGQDSVPATLARVFCANSTDSTYIADFRSNGEFVFKELRPNKTYEIYAITKVKISVDSPYKNLEERTPVQTVVVREPYKYYPDPEVGDPELSITIIENL